MFNSVFHITHLADAYRIFEDGRIRASSHALFREDSRLGDTQVVWLSPKVWDHGSFYGNIVFKFDWRKLIQGKRLYWVEGFQSKRPVYRILLTDKQSGLDLKPYPVEDRHGPLYYDSKKHLWYHNNEFIGELVIDSDVLLSECDAVGFENHHDTICTRYWRSCADLGHQGFVAGSRFLSYLIANNVLRERKDLRRLFLKGRSFHQHAEEAWRSLLRIFPIETRGKLTHRDRDALRMVASMLGRWATENELPGPAHLFRSKKELELVLRGLAAKAFGLPVSKIPGFQG